MDRKVVQFNADDAGIVIEATLSFTDFDPAGATAALATTLLGDEAPPRDMDLSGAVATYEVAAGDFKAGYHIAEVRVTKAGVTVTSEEFLIVVNP